MSHVAALIRERDGYLARGMTERAAQVDRQLELAGVPTSRPAPQDDVRTATVAPDDATCPECGRTFKNGRGLAIHQASHDR